MWLVLADARDASAQWAYQGLTARGLNPIHFISSDMLAYTLRWDHRIGVDGVSTELCLADGTVIRHDNVTGTLNRLQMVPEAHLARARAEDRMYAASELHAFYVSWLTSLGAVMLNRPAPQGLCGHWRHASEWVRMAAEAGLRTPHYEQSSRSSEIEPYALQSLLPPNTTRETVYIIGDYTASISAPEDVKQGCRRLAQAAKADLLSVEIGWMPDGAWTFGGASIFPELIQGGPAVLDALAAALRGEEADA